MEDLFSYVAPAYRQTDPITSKMAAERAALTASKSRMTVLRLLMERPMTDFDLAEATGSKPTSIGCRRNECTKHGLVEKALDGDGEIATGRSDTGSPAIIWQITPAGRTFYAEHGG